MSGGVTVLTSSSGETPWGVPCVVICYDTEDTCGCVPELLVRREGTHMLGHCTQVSNVLGHCTHGIQVAAVVLVLLSINTESPCFADNSPCFVQQLSLEDCH